MGDAPSVIRNHSPGSSFFINSTDFKAYFFSGKIGFSFPTWMGYPAVNIGDYSPISPWLISNGYSHDTALEVDLDGDGVSLLMAYSLNLNPRLNLSGYMPRPVLGSEQMTLTFYAGSEGVTYTVESSPDLRSWSKVGVSLSAPDINLFRTATLSTTQSGFFMRIVATY